LRLLLDGKFTEAFYRAAEILTGPPGEDVDFNWPPDKFFNVVPLPAGLNEGDTFLIGDGEGGRATAEIVVQDSLAGAVLVDGSYRHVYEHFYEEAEAEARLLLDELRT
jgi:hypothetical protein